MMGRKENQKKPKHQKTPGPSNSIKTPVHCGDHGHQLLHQPVDTCRAQDACVVMTRSAIAAGEPEEGGSNVGINKDRHKTSGGLTRRQRRSFSDKRVRSIQPEKMSISTGALIAGATFLICTFHIKGCVSLDNMTTVAERTLNDFNATGIDDMAEIMLNDTSSNTTDLNYPGDELTSMPDMDYSQYESMCEKASNRKFRSWFLPTVYSLICLVGLVGNLLVMLTYLYFRRLKTMTDVYLLNLAAADLLLVLTLPFWAANFLDKWILGEFMCKAMYSIYKISFFSGILLLTCISIDRYFAISRAVSAHRHRSRAVYFSKVSSLILWTLALLFSVPEMAYTQLNENQTCTPFSGDASQLRVSIQVGQMVGGFALPAIIMGFCYFSIIQTLMQARNFEKNKAIKVIFAVVAVFLIFQLPYNITMFIGTVDRALGGNKNCVFDNGLLFAMDITQSLAFMRCCLNPFLYAFIGVKFRHDLLRLLKDLGCVSQRHFFKYTSCSRKRPSVDTETTTSFSP
ncbi:C-C chemokine receptor type 7-like [Arapaima gigas]